MTRTLLKKSGIVDKHALIVFFLSLVCQNSTNACLWIKKTLKQCCFNEIYLITITLFTTETKESHSPTQPLWLQLDKSDRQSFDCQAAEVKGERKGTPFHLAETKVPFVTMRQSHTVMDLECYWLCGETALEI